MDVLGFNHGCRALAIRSVGAANFIGCMQSVGQFDDFEFTDISSDLGNEFANIDPGIDYGGAFDSFDDYDFGSYGDLGSDWNALGNPGDISPEIGSSGVDSLVSPDAYADIGNVGQDSVGMTISNAGSSGFSNFLSGVLKAGAGLGVQMGLASLLGSPNKPSGQNAAPPNTNLNRVPPSPTTGLQNSFMLPNALNVANQASMTSTSQILPAGVSPTMVTIGLLAVGAILLMKK